MEHKILATHGVVYIHRAWLGSTSARVARFISNTVNHQITKLASCTVPFDDIKVRHESLGIDSPAAAVVILAFRRCTLT